MSDRTNAQRQARFREKQALERMTLKLEKLGLQMENEGTMKLLEQEREQHSVVLENLWKVIKMQHDAMTASGSTMEWFFDVTPQEHKAKAAKRIDLYNHLLNDCDKLIEPMRAIMETSNLNPRETPDT